MYETSRSSVDLSRQRGFSLFEIVLVVLLIGVFMSIAIDRMLQLQFVAERASVQQLLGTLESVVNLQAADLVVHKGLSSMRTLENCNPMLYLQEPPQNYLGLKDDRDAGQLKKGTWYFDPNENILVYIVENTGYFETNLSGTPRIRFQVSLIYRGNIDTGRADEIRGVTIKSLDDYHWKAL
jgi:prepilin-type N-terminal cleavage/methylation domain-containing protein